MGDYLQEFNAVYGINVKNPGDWLRMPLGWSGSHAARDTKICSAVVLVFASLAGARKSTYDIGHVVNVMAHNFDQALSESGRALANDPGFAWHRIFQGWAHLGKGATGEAEAAIRKGAELSGASVHLSILGHAQAVNGNREGALRTLERLTAQSRNGTFRPMSWD